MKNEGELPMYWSEDTHPKIIDLEVYEKVQDELARRRQLGSRANMSLNVTCFTSNIHCSCGRNFQRSQRNKRDGSKEKYVVWMCAGKKDSNRKGCINPSITEYILKNKCCEVLGIENFSEDIFYKNIKDINVLEPGLLEFVFKDGSRKK